MNFEQFTIADLRARNGFKWRRYGPDVLPAWVADMDFPVAEPIQTYIQDAAARSDFGYPSKTEAEALPALFAARMANKYGWQVPVERTILLTDIVQGLYWGVLGNCREGEGAVIQTPIYPPFLRSVEDTGRRPVLCPLVMGSNGFEIDFDAMAANIDENTRLFMLCNPHNPGGRAYRRDELEKIAELVLRHDLIVLADEIHSDLVFDGHTHVPFATLSPEIAARTITFNSANKSFNIAGLRVGIAVFGSDELLQAFSHYPDRTRGGLTSFACAASRIAWESCDDWLTAAIAYLQDNRDFMTTFLRERMPAVGYAPPEATYLAWLDFNQVPLGAEPLEFFLEKSNVALYDGTAFGPQGSGCTRINFATPRPILTEILERMAGAVDQL
ncbi:MAG: putative C-S lyase [Chromatiales bacterium]|jgi:cysteine-S-conjugate beta-lyase|nr:putative C-S lyase [Chromatiales bacterium]